MTQQLAVRTEAGIEAVVSQDDIRGDGTLNPQSRAFLEKLLVHTVNDFSTMTHKAKADIEISIEMKKVVKR